MRQAARSRSPRRARGEPSTRSPSRRKGARDAEAESAALLQRSRSPRQARGEPTRRSPSRRQAAKQVEPESSEPLERGAPRPLPKKLSFADLEKDIGVIRLAPEMKSSDKGEGHGAACFRFRAEGKVCDHAASVLVELNVCGSGSWSHNKKREWLEKHGRHHALSAKEYLSERLAELSWHSSSEGKDEWSARRRAHWDVVIHGESLHVNADIHVVLHHSSPRGQPSAIPKRARSQSRRDASQPKESYEAEEGLTWRELCKSGKLMLKPQIAKTGAQTVGWRLHGHVLVVKGEEAKLYIDVNILNSGEWTREQKDRWVEDRKRLAFHLDAQAVLGHYFKVLPWCKRTGSWQWRFKGWSWGMDDPKDHQEVRVNATAKVGFDTRWAH